MFAISPSKPWAIAISAALSAFMIRKPSQKGGGRGGRGGSRWEVHTEGRPFGKARTHIIDTYDAEFAAPSTPRACPRDDLPRTVRIVDLLSSHGS